MARFKVLAHRIADASAWAALGAATLFAAYEGSALAAHMGRWVEWR